MLSRSFSLASTTLLKNIKKLNTTRVRNFTNDTTSQTLSSIQSEADAKVEKVVQEPLVQEPAEFKSGNLKVKEFQAETKQLLDIVTNSLYTDKEVFVRELVSNASDALEKLRYYELSNKEIYQKHKPLEVRINTNETDHTITFSDSGLGMTESELIENIGTIARSGSKQFVKQMKEKEGAPTGNAENSIIGQFGVGFYSSFMVGSKIEVFSQSYTGEPAHYWVSDGLGQYELSTAENVNRGTKIIITLKKECYEYAIRHNIERIVKKYSNFVGFPIFLNNEKVNTVRALWLEEKSNVTTTQYEEFYRYLTNSFDKPSHTLHFNTDIPLAIHALFYIPEVNASKFGMTRLEPSVNLYSRKVLIQAKCPTILPDWLAFVKGVVDSEDIPLNISRETMQDSALIKKIRSVLTRKILSYLDSEGKNNKESYAKFYKEYGSLIKEGIVSDQTNKEPIAKLLRFETSTLADGEMSSLDEYISRMSVTQNELFYLCAPSRAACEASPYYEQFKSNNIEVLFSYTQFDDMVMKSIGEFSKRKLVSIESSEAGKNLKADTETAEKEGSGSVQEKLNSTQVESLIKFLERSLSDKASSVVVSTRLVSSPAIILDHESAAMRKLMEMMDQGQGQKLSAMRKQKLEINPNHSIMKKLSKMISINSNNPKANLVAEQIFDNASIAAGLMDDPRTMLKRLNMILEDTMTGYEAKEAAPEAVFEPLKEKASDKVEEKPASKPSTIDSVAEAQWEEVVKKL